MRVRGETLGGQRVGTARVYRTCREPERPVAPAAPPPAPVIGGGED